MLNVIVFLASAVLGGYLLFMGAGHLITKRAAMTQYAAYKGVPYASILVPFTGVLLVVAGLGVWGIVAGWFAAAAALLFFVPVSFKMHPFWNVEDEMDKQSEFVNFTKNVAILSGLLIVLLA